MSGIQSHLTIAFPIKSPTDAKALAEELPPLMPDFAKAQDSAGTVHYSRFLALGIKHCSSSPTLTVRKRI